MEELKLHGFWYSPFTMRVVWTLKLKGIPCEYIEEDRFNKSPQLLEYNLHKKALVLVHAGKPICESMIIVEYINEIWPQNPLVPADPYERAQARFWFRYAQMAPVAAVLYYFISGDEERKKAIEKVWEHRVVEDQCLVDQKKFFRGNTINSVDIAFGSIFKLLVTLEDMNELIWVAMDRLGRVLTQFEPVPYIIEQLSICPYSIHEF